MPTNPFITEALKHPDEDLRLMSSLSGKDIDTIRTSALDAGAKTVVGLGGLGALALGREKIRKRELEAAEGEREEGYRKMLEKSPDLASHKEPGLVREYYDTLFERAPSAVKHPHFTGNWVRGHLNYGKEGIPASSLADLDTLQKGHESTVRGQLSLGSATALVTGNPLLTSTKVK